MKDAYYMIPEEFLKAINEKQDHIIELLSNPHEKTVSEYITEKQAMEIFQRKATWFWQMRKSGILPFSKIGKAIYYSVNDLKRVLEDGRTNSTKISKT